MQREIDERGAGEHDGARDGVVGKPGVGRQGQLPGEQNGVAVGQGDGRGKQRMAGGVKTGGGDVARGGGGQPVAAALEGIGGQVRAAGGGAEHGGPVGPDVVDVQVGQGQQQALPSAFTAAQGAGDGCRGAVPGRSVVESLLDADGENRMGAGFDECPVSVADGGADGRVEADGLS